MDQEFVSYPSLSKSSTQWKTRSYSGKSTNSFRINGDSAYDHSLKLQHWISDKALKAIQNVSDEEVRGVHKETDPILERESTFHREMTKLISHKELCELRKKEVNNLRWNKTIFEPLCNHIDSVMQEKSGPEGYHKQRQVLHQNYIDHLNKKGTVSLDVYSPDEYYPFMYQTTRAQTAPPQLRPISSIGQKQRDSEDLLLLRCYTGKSFRPEDLKGLQLQPSEHQGKREMGWNQWNVMPLGFIDSNIRKRSRMRFGGNFNRSNVHLNFQCSPGLHQKAVPRIVTLRPQHTIHCTKFPGDVNQMPA